MNDGTDDGIKAMAPVWTTFGDLMLVLLGVPMLILVGVIGVQLELSSRLENEVKQCEAEVQHRRTLEQALTGPLTIERVTFVNGHIGINGNALSVINLDQLQSEDRALMKSLAGLLAAYLISHEEIPMVSGFLDDQQVRAGNRLLADNWELSVRRASMVARMLIDEGIPVSNVFATAFGSQQPVSPNAGNVGRAKSRRVEITLVPRQAVSNSGRREPYWGVDTDHAQQLVRKRYGPAGPLAFLLHRGVVSMCNRSNRRDVPHSRRAARRADHGLHGRPRSSGGNVRRGRHKCTCRQRVDGVIA